MKIKSVLAVGAMGVGLGVAGLVGGTATASAACGDLTTPLLDRANCLVSQDLGTFQETVNPLNGIPTLIYGGDPADDGPYGGLGLTQQLDTFKNSIVGTPDTTGFLGGPISSQDPKAP